MTEATRLLDPDVSLDDVDVVVKTFLRPARLEQLVASVARYYPAVRLHIADDSPATEPTRALHQSLERQGHTVYRLPFDVGLSAGRNHLIDATSRPFMLLLDDDFVFDAETRIESLLEVAMCRPDAGVVAGLVVDLGGAGVDRGPRRFQRDARGVLHLLPVKDSVDIAGHRCHAAEMVGNFGLFRRRMLDEVRWDPSLKVHEHVDFFLRVARSGWRVLAVGDVVVGHDVRRVSRYASFRHSRGAIYRELGLQKAGVLEVCSHLGSERDIRSSVLVAHVSATLRAVAARRWRSAIGAAWVAVGQVEPSREGFASALRGAWGVAKRRATVVGVRSPRPASRP